MLIVFSARPSPDMVHDAPIRLCAMPRHCPPHTALRRAAFAGARQSARYLGWRLFDLLDRHIYLFTHILISAVTRAARAYARQ